MATVYAVTNGTLRNLTDGTLCYWMGQDGLGMMPVHRLRERGPQQHGEVDLGYRADPRTFRLMFGIPASSLSDLYTKRSALISYFCPATADLAVRLALDNGATRQIDCAYIGDMQMPTVDRAGFYQTVAVSLDAPDPTLYDPSEQAATWTIAAFSGLLFPEVGETEPGGTFPIILGSGVISDTLSVTYTGNVDSYPIIEITGPLSAPKVTNLTTNEVLDLSSYTVSAGETVTIDCRYGYKTITNTNGTNLLSYLSDASDLATFHLAAAIDGTSSRVNELYAQGGSGVAAQTQIALRYYRRYAGL